MKKTKSDKTILSSPATHKTAKMKKKKKKNLTPSNTGDEANVANATSTPTTTKKKKKHSLSSPKTATTTSSPSPASSAVDDPIVIKQTKSTLQQPRKTFDEANKKSTFLFEQDTTTTNYCQIDKKLHSQTIEDDDDDDDDDDDEQEEEFVLDMAMAEKTNAMQRGKSADYDRVFVHRRSSTDRTIVGNTEREGGNERNSARQGGRRSVPGAFQVPVTNPTVMEGGAMDANADDAHVENIGNGNHFVGGLASANHTHEVIVIPQASLVVDGADLEAQAILPPGPDDRPIVHAVATQNDNKTEPFQSTNKGILDDETMKRRKRNFRILLLTVMVVIAAILIAILVQVLQKEEDDGDSGGVPMFPPPPRRDGDPPVNINGNWRNQTDGDNGNTTFNFPGSQ
jgi:hypothetical protein